tara:strand:+ start:60 stop:296 length:237 start_codon:yes stop_codon:yes gene_type:complete
MIARHTPVGLLYSDISVMLYNGLNAKGGSFSAEHGIGNEKQASPRKFADLAKLSLMRATKAAIYPMNIMNRGKVLPSP